MTKVRTWAGLDVHAAATVACVVDVPSGEMSVQRLAGRTSEVTAFCARLPAPVRVAYEAGPTGFVRAREDIRGDLMRSRHRLGKLLLRHDVRYDDTASAWTTAHRAWLSRVDL